MRKMGFILMFFIGTINLSAQSTIYSVQFNIVSSSDSKTMALAELRIDGYEQIYYSDKQGIIKFTIDEGEYTIQFFKEGYDIINRKYFFNQDTIITIELNEIAVEMDPLEIIADENNNFSNGRLNNVEGTSVYAGKKNDVILMDKIDANLSTNNSRQIFSKISGLNIWESDAAGLQLGIGGRGLSPNRTSNFNTRQNGYDMSADALGYPESYYTPPSESVERIEVIRGASSLQYGTQFGGVVNFVTKKGNRDKPFEFISRQALGSFGLFNSFNSAGGTIKKRFNYYAFYNYKNGNGWRENSEFNQQTAYASFRYSITENIEIYGDYTFMNYLAHQPGGLTDAMFQDDPQKSIRERNWFKVNWNLFSLSLNYSVSSKTKINIRNFGLIASRLALGYLGSINRADPLTERDLISGYFKNFGNETRFLHRYKIKKSIGVFLTGMRYYRGRTIAKQGKANNESGPDFNYLTPEEMDYSDYLFPSENLAFFVENIFYINSKLSLTPGLRLENIRTSTKGFYKIRNTDFAGNVIYEEKVINSTNYNRFVPLAGLGISYKLNPSFEFYANTSQNYRAINFSDVQVVNPNAKVNPDIEDEFGYNADFGFRGNNSKTINYDISFFYLRYNNRIGEILQTDPSNLTVYRYRTNIADSRNLGVEFFVETDLIRIINDSTKHSLKLFVNTSWIDARYLASEQNAVENKKVELVPELTVRTGLSYSFKNFSLQTQFSQCSMQYSDATNAEYTTNAIYGTIPSYYVIDFSGSYSFKRFKFETGVNNLTDQKYFTRRAVSYPGPGIIPAIGRNFYFCLQFRI